MLNRGLDKLELLRIVEAVAAEKSIDKELVIGSMESAIQKAALTKFGNDNSIEVSIDRETGEIKILKGQLLLNHFIRAIPSKIFPTKHEYPIAEPLISKITNSPLYSRDTTDSFQSFSYADFGIFGLFFFLSAQFYLP